MAVDAEPTLHACHAQNVVQLPRRKKKHSAHKNKTNTQQVVLNKNSGGIV